MVEIIIKTLASVAIVLTSNRKATKSRNVVHRTPRLKTLIIEGKTLYNVLFKPLSSPNTELYALG